jgi:hypothetical protein
MTDLYAGNTLHGSRGHAVDAHPSRPRVRADWRGRVPGAVATVAVLLLSSFAGLTLASSHPAVGIGKVAAPSGTSAPRPVIIHQQPTPQTPTADPAGSPFAFNSSAVSLGLGNGVGSLPSTFWGVNYNYAAPSGPDQNSFANSTIAHDLNETPITWLRLPLVSEDPGASYNSSFNWSSAFEFCDWEHCHSLVTVGGAGESAQNGAWEVQYIEDHYHFYPDYWIFGNEPDVYDWASPSAYASTVHQWILDVRAFDPTAQFMGISVTGDPSVDDAYLTDLMEQDGSLINAFAIQTYPDQPPDLTLSNFMGSLSGPHSVLYESENARSIVDSYGGTDLPMFDNEYNGGGTGITAWDQFRQGYPDVPYTATSVIQGLDAHLDQLAPWTFTSVNGLTVNEGDGCDNAMIELTSECNGIAGTYNPMFYLYSQILKQLPFGSLTNVTLPGFPDLWGIQVTNGSTRDVLVVNDNVATPRTFDLGPGFPVSGNLSTRLLDPANPEQPLETVLPLNTTSPTFTLPALGVLLLQFTPGSAAPPPAGNGGAPPTPHTVTFVRSGLPTGTNWSVALNGLIKASSTSSIVFPGLTALFTYDVASVFGYYPVSGFGMGNASLGNLSIPIVYTAGTTPALSIRSFGVFPSTPLFGVPFTLTVATVGGQGPYAYSYAGLPLTCQPVDGSTISCSPSPNGTYDIAVSVADGNGGVVEETLNVTVSGSPPAASTPPPAAPPSSGIAAYGLLGLFSVLVSGGLIAGVEVVSFLRHRGGRRPSPRVNQKAPYFLGRRAVATGRPQLAPRPPGPPPTPWPGPGGVPRRG